MIDLLEILEDDRAFGELVEDIRARCTHPNLFGCKGHCVRCGEDVGELRLVPVDGLAVQP